MPNIRRYARLVWAVVLLVISLWPSTAFAMCDYVNEYTDSYAGDPGETSVPLVARGTAEGSGEDCNLYIEVELLDPSANRAAFRSASGINYVSTTASVDLDENSPEGEWHAGLMTWDNGSYIGCGGAWDVVSIHITYWKDDFPSGPNCTYASLACTPPSTPTCVTRNSIGFDPVFGCRPILKVWQVKLEGHCFPVGVSQGVFAAGMCT